MARKGCCDSRPRCRNCPLRKKRDKTLALADDRCGRKIVVLLAQR